MKKDVFSTKRINLQTKMEYDIAQLRHLYTHLLQINPSLANNLLAPSIERLEKICTDIFYPPD